MKKLNYILPFFFLACSHQTIKTSPKFVFEENLMKKNQKLISRNLSGELTVKELEVSPKRLYFKALLRQTQRLSLALNQVLNLKNCPQFHQDYIELQKLPVAVQVGLSSVEDLHIALKKSSKELETMCEIGETAQYFKVENLITYHTNHRSFHHDPASFHKLVKIPVFANYYYSPSSKSLEEDDFFKISHTEWFKKYVDDVTSFYQTKDISGVQ